MKILLDYCKYLFRKTHNNKKSSKIADQIKNRYFLTKIIRYNPVTLSSQPSLFQHTTVRYSIPQIEASGCSNTSRRYRYTYSEFYTYIHMQLAAGMQNGKTKNFHRSSCLKPKSFSRIIAAISVMP